MKIITFVYQALESFLPLPLEAKGEITELKTLMRERYENLGSRTDSTELAKKAKIVLEDPITRTILLFLYIPWTKYISSIGKEKNESVDELKKLLEDIDKDG